MSHSASVTIFAGILVIVAPVLLVWALRPLLSPKPSEEKARFNIADMYVLVLQIAFAGLFLSKALKAESFLVGLASSAFVLALIWGCILSALNERGISGSIRRCTILFIAPIHILCCIGVPFVALGIDAFPLKYQNTVCGTLVLSLFVPLIARTIFVRIAYQEPRSDTIS